MVTPMYFQPLSFQEANPYLTAIQTGQAIRSQALKNQLSQIQNQYTPAEYQANIGLTQAKIPLTNAQTGLTNAQTQFYPLTAQGGYLKGMGDYLRGMYLNNPAMWASRFQNNPAFQSMVANNPGLASQYTNLMAGSLNSPSISMPTALNNPQAMQPNPSAPPAGNIGLPSDASDPNNLVSPPDISNVQNAANSEYIKKTTPGPILNQRYTEQSAENMLNKVAPDMPEIAQFAGLAGKANMTADKYAAATNTLSDPSYVKFNNFVTTQAPVIANDIRRALGGQATDSEQRVMGNLANPVYWKTNPALAISQFNSLVDILRANAKAITLSPSQNINALQQGIQNPPYAKATQAKPNLNATQADIEYTAKLHGLTADQVKQRLGIQ
jgi:hypothetical protein